MKKTILYLLLLPVLAASGQDMQEGFQMLNAGQFPEATQFFSNILEEYPEDRTARLCYARAIGLNGQPAEALEVFSSLIVEYPNDFELKLNYAESLLWNGDFEAAQAYYAILLEDHPQSFPVHLGYANTLANLKQFENSLHYITQALKIEPQNSEAKKSLKYIRIGLADQFMKRAQFDTAVALLEKNLEIYEGDRETLLNIANVYLNQHEFDLAAATYRKVMRTRLDSIEAFNGLSLVYHLKNQNGKARKKSEQASILVQTLDQEQYSELIKNTLYRKAEAQIWDKKFSAAKRTLSEIKDQYADQPRTLAVLAQYSMYRRNYHRGQSLYQNLLVQDSLSFDGNLGSVDALLASGHEYESYKLAKKTRGLFAGNIDAQRQYQKIAGLFRPSLSTAFFMSQDNADNIAYGMHMGARIPLKPKMSILVNGSLRNTKNRKTSLEAGTKAATVGVSYDILPRMQLDLNVGILSTTSLEKNNQRSLLDLKIKGKAGRISDFVLGIRKELQDFNSVLIDRNILQNHYYGEYAFNTPNGIGLFAQYFYTSQSDDNQRHLFFGSLYYLIREIPNIKVGVNYQLISFQKQVPQFYFSPERFNAQEVFIELSKDQATALPKQLFYTISVAAGRQHIANQESQGTYRVKAMLGIRASHRTSAMISLLSTNISSASAGGFTYTQVQVGLKWDFSSAPLFKVD